MRYTGLLVGLTLALALETSARAEPLSPLTCHDWYGMSLERQASYVLGVIEGISLATVTAAANSQPQVPVEQQLALAEQWASRLVAERRVTTYVSVMTAICRDATWPPDAPLGVVFLSATHAFKTHEPSRDARAAPRPGPGR